MKKILKFIKENLLISIFVIIILIIILVVFIALIKKGTFSIETENSVTIECPSEANSPSEIECNIRIKYNESTYNDNNKILSVNANYDLPNGIEYVSYLSNCSDCDIDEYTEDGFAIAKLAGLTNDSIIGTVTFSIPDDIEFGTEYTIGLKNVEFCDSEENMIEIDNSQDKITIDDGTLSYKFTSSNYLYNEDNNYIYTKTDTDNIIISKLDALNPGFSYNINDNKLEVKNTREQVIKSIDIINFTATDLTISADSIIINSSVTVSNIMNKITLNGLTIKIASSEGNDKTDDETVNDGDKLNIYYNSDVIGTYTFSVGHLEFANDINVDDTSSIIYNLPVNNSYSYLINKIDTSGEIIIYDKNDDVKSSSDLMSTSDKITITLGNEIITYTISVLGDMNHDGKISINDVSKLYQLNKKFETSPPELIYIFTGDMNHDGTYSINDVSKLYQMTKQGQS